MADKNGHIDLTYQAMAALSGWPIDLLKQAVGELMQPDPESRSEEAEGRRLELIDPTNRQWGWRVVNHTKYREKARKSASEAERVASGANRERMAKRKYPRSPALTRADRPSDSDTNTYANTDTNAESEGMQGGRSRATRSTATRLAEDFELTEARKQVAEAEGIDPSRTFASFCDYWKSAGGQKARKHDWDATWRNWCRSDADRKKTATAPRKTRYEQIMEKLNAS